MTDFTCADQDGYYAKMQTSTDAAAMRQFAHDTFGATWSQQVIGF